MFEVQITVNAPELTGAINNLAAAIGAAKVFEATKTVEQVTPQAAPQAVENANPTTPAVAPVQAQAVAPMQPVTAGAPVNTTPSAPSAPAPSNVTPPTIDALSRAGAALCEQGKMPQLIDLLGRYGVQAVTQLNGAAPDVLNAFSNDLRALGADI